MDLNDFFLSNSDINIINKWQINFSKPLFISGYIGIGKTTLLNIILKDYTKVYINNIINNIEEYIDKCINQKDISMMLSKKKNKCIIFDNLIYKDKKTISIIKNLILKNYKCHIVIISADINNRSINKLTTKCSLINIKYTYDQFKYLVCKKYNNIPIDLIYKSNFNFNFIESNYNFYRINANNINNNIANNINNIKSNKIDSYTDNINILTEKFKNDYNINHFFIEFSGDYNTICLNILDDISKNIKNKDLSSICNIYKYICIYDNYEIFKVKNYIFTNIDYSIFYSIYAPYIIIKNNNIKLSKNILYNSYLSKSLIYTNLNSIYSIHNNIYEIYDIISRLVYDINKNKNEIIKIYNKYDCSNKLLNVFIKLCNFIFNKQININNIKILNKII